MYLTILQAGWSPEKRQIMQQGISSPIIELCIWNSRAQDYLAFNLNAPFSMFFTTSRRIYSRQDSQFITYTYRIQTYSAFSSFLVSLRQRYPSFSCRHSATTGLSTKMSLFIVEQVVAVYRLICRWEARRTTCSMECSLGSFSQRWQRILTMRVIRVQQISVFQISISRQMHVVVFRFLVTLWRTGTSQQLIVVCSYISGVLFLGCSMRQQKRKPNCGCFRRVGLTETLTSYCELNESSGAGWQLQAFYCSYFSSLTNLSRICQLYERIIKLITLDIAQLCWLNVTLIMVAKFGRIS